MTKFTDGPARGVVLQLGRAPLFLRVVHDPAYAAAICKKGRTEWDALDKLTDKPAAHEVIYVYRKVSNDAGLVHIDGRGKDGRRFGMTLSPATYAFVEEQPADDVLRDSQKWAEWATERAKQCTPTP